MLRSLLLSPSRSARSASPAGAITFFVTGTVTETFYVDRSPFPEFPAEGPFVELVRDMTVGDTFEVAIDYLDVPCGPVDKFVQPLGSRAGWM